MHFTRKVRDGASVIANLQAGESLGCSGVSKISWIIRIGTFSVFSHIMPVVRVRAELLRRMWENRELPRIKKQYIDRWGDVDKLVIVEATTLCDQDCLLMGRPVRGVQCHEIADRVTAYDGRVWRVPINVDYRLTREQEDLYAAFMLRKVGSEYDDLGAIKAGWRAVVGLSLHDQETKKWFCDKLAAEGLKSVGKFPMINTDTITPASFIRQGRKIGLFAPVTNRERIK